VDFGVVMGSVFVLLVKTPTIGEMVIFAERIF
jgi:hypothetical protein